MKTIQLSILTTIMFLIFTRCSQIPDLNPLTISGADVTVYELYDTLSLQDYEYDLDNDGTIDLLFDYSPGCASFPSTSDFNLELDGLILIDIFKMNDLIEPPLIVNSNDNGLAIGGLYRSFDANLFIASTSGYFVCTKTWRYIIPTGTKYIQFKMNINNEEHYGWLEYTSTWSAQNGSNIEGDFILNKVGIADEPGFQLRAGQTD